MSPVPTRVYDTPFAFPRSIRSFPIPFYLIPPKATSRLRSTSASRARTSTGSSTPPLEPSPQAGSPAFSLVSRARPAPPHPRRRRRRRRRHRVRSAPNTTPSTMAMCMTQVGQSTPRTGPGTPGRMMAAGRTGRARYCPLLNRLCHDHTVVKGRRKGGRRGGEGKGSGVFYYGNGAPCRGRTFDGHLTAIWSYCMTQGAHLPPSGPSPHRGHQGYRSLLHR